MSASYESPYEIQCFMKRTFLRAGDAKRAARRTAAQFGGRPLVHYRCNWCDKYHIGHPSPFAKQREAV